MSRIIARYRTKAVRFRTLLPVDFSETFNQKEFVGWHIGWGIIRQLSCYMDGNTCLTTDNRIAVVIPDWN